MITIKVKEDSEQAKSFLEYAKTLSFVEFEEKKVIPIEKIPNETSLKSMEKTSKGIEMTKTNSHKDLMEKLFS